MGSSVFGVIFVDLVLLVHFHHMKITVEKMEMIHNKLLKINQKPQVRFQLITSRVKINESPWPILTVEGLMVDSAP